MGGTEALEHSPSVVERAWNPHRKSRVCRCPQRSRRRSRSPRFGSQLSASAPCDREMITQRSKPPLPPTRGPTRPAATSGRADRRGPFGPGTYGGPPQRQAGGLSHCRARAPRRVAPAHPAASSRRGAPPDRHAAAQPEPHSRTRSRSSAARRRPRRRRSTTASMASPARGRRRARRPTCSRSTRGGGRRRARRRRARSGATRPRRERGRQRQRSGGRARRRPERRRQPAGAQLDNDALRAEVKRCRPRSSTSSRAEQGDRRLQFRMPAKADADAPCAQCAACAARSSRCAATTASCASSRMAGPARRCAHRARGGRAGQARRGGARPDPRARARCRD